VEDAGDLMFGSSGRVKKNEFVAHNQKPQLLGNVGCLFGGGKQNGESRRREKANHPRSRLTMNHAIGGANYERRKSEGRSGRSNGLGKRIVDAETGEKG